MSRWIELETPHGPVRAWRGEPLGPPRGGVVVLQEIFGVNGHIRDITRRLADAGYTAIAPALFDPVERDVELGYDEAAAQRGVELRNEVGFDRAVGITESAITLLQDEGLRTAATGFCWGGTLAFLANTRTGVPAVSFYGARTAPFLGEPLRAPMMFHFGNRDSSIPAEVVERHRVALPRASIHVYDAGHGFNCDQRSDYHAESATLAWQRTLDFLAEALR